MGSKNVKKRAKAKKTDNGTGKGFSSIKKKVIDHIKDIPAVAGVYKLYNRWKQLIYIGVSNNLAQRLRAHLYGISDYAKVESKKKLFEEAYYFCYMVCDIETAREIEHKTKSKCVFNVL